MDQLEYRYQQGYPNKGDLASLRRRFHLTGISSFSDEELFRWYGYHYGFRRAILGDMEPRSPIDPDGAWFNEDLAASAAQMYRARRPAPRDSARFRKSDEWRDRFAKSKGFVDFEQVMKHGIVNAFRMPDIGGNA